MLITIDALADYGYTNMPRAQCETWSAKLNLDGSTELEYGYDSDKAPGSEVIHLTCNAELMHTNKDAIESYNMLIGALKLGIKIAGKADLKAQPDLISFGDESYAAIITTGEGEPAGNLVVIRKGRIVHSLILIGLYFDERELLEELFETVMDNSSPDRFGEK